MNKKQGIIKLVVLLVIAIIVLSYFRVDLRKVIESEMVQTNFAYVWGFIQNIWQTYLAQPFQTVWNKVIVGVVWQNLTQPK